MLKPILSIIIIAVSICAIFPKSLYSTTDVLAHGLHNPRGLIPLANGDLIILEAGTGEKLVGQHSGKISRWSDMDQDRQVDPPERTFLREGLYSYNIMEVFNPGRDEVVGLGDGLLRNDQTLIYTRDTGRETTEVVQLDLDDLSEIILIERPGVVNSITLTADQQTLFLAESTLNQIGAYQFESGYEEVLLFDVLANQQQAVPTGLTLDAEGNLIVSLFSEQPWASGKRFLLCQVMPRLLKWI